MRSLTVLIRPSPFGESERYLYPIAQALCVVITGLGGCLVDLDEVGTRIQRSTPILTKVPLDEASSTMIGEGGVSLPSQRMMRCFLPWGGR